MVIVCEPQHFFSSLCFCHEMGRLQQQSAGNIALSAASEGQVITAHCVFDLPLTTNTLNRNTRVGCQYTDVLPADKEYCLQKAMQ